MESRNFEAVYQEHVWAVYGFIGYRVDSREDAEDLTQMTFERALQAWGRYDSSRASAQTWLIAIARNVIIDAYRRRKARPDPVAVIPESGHRDLVTPGPEESSLGLSPDLDAALRSLGEREREVIALRFGGGMSGAEIADMTGLTVANVQQIISRTLRRLRDRLAQVENSETG